MDCEEACPQGEEWPEEKEFLLWGVSGWDLIVGTVWAVGVVFIGVLIIMRGGEIFYFVVCGFIFVIFR